ncbi:MAG: alpha/beta hydrolase [Pseudomonadota bacterium]|nr:alpha/beta hydrolase [Pseudomonadota bacterium]
MQQDTEAQEGWTRFEYSAPDGLLLAGRLYGAAHDDALPVVCLAGLTRNSADFHELALHLSRDAARPRKVFCPDYRGRGISARDSDWRNYHPLTEADDVLAGMAAAGLEGAAFVGTSRGGMIAMILAAMRPTVLKAVVLNDVGPEIDSDGIARIRAYVEKGRDFDNWQEAVAAVRAIAAQQFPGFDDRAWQRQARLIFEEKDGRVVRRYDPAIMKTLAAIDPDRPLPTMWPQFEGLKRMKLLTIRGALSDLLSSGTLETMRAKHPEMEVITVEDQGHAPDLGTRDLPERIAAFIASAEGARR